MKIVFFGGLPERDTKDMDPYDIRNLSDVYSYFLRREFERMGIRTDHCFKNEKTPEAMIPEADHLLSVCQRSFHTGKNYYVKYLPEIRESIPGKVATVCDHQLSSGGMLGDIVFHARPSKLKRKKNVYVGWACDHSEYLFPEKDPDKFRILLDHSYYYPGHSKDLSVSLAKQCLEFKNRYREKEVIIRRFSGSSGLETLTPESNLSEVFDRRNQSIPYPVACEEYRKADIFIVTHPESMGMSVLESAAGGALTVCPLMKIFRPYIQYDFLRPLHYITFRKNIPWGRVLDSLNMEETRKKAEPYSWSNVAKIMLREFEK